MSFKRRTKKGTATSNKSILRTAARDMNELKSTLKLERESIDRDIIACKAF